MQNYLFITQMCIYFVFMDAKKLINWAELSRSLIKEGHGDRGGIRVNKIPKKYLPKIRRLIKLINEWQNEKI
jgi:hypothetical protein